MSGVSNKFPMESFRCDSCHLISVSFKISTSAKLTCSLVRFLRSCVQDKGLQMRRLTQGCFVESYGTLHLSHRAYGVRVLASQIPFPSQQAAQRRMPEGPIRAKKYYFVVMKHLSLRRRIVPCPGTSKLPIHSLILVALDRFSFQFRGCSPPGFAAKVVEKSLPTTLKPKIGLARSSLPRIPPIAYPRPAEEKRAHCSHKWNPPLALTPPRFAWSAFCSTPRNPQSPVPQRRNTQSRTLIQAMKPFSSFFSVHCSSGISIHTHSVCMYVHSALSLVWLGPAN